MADPMLVDLERRYPGIVLPTHYCLPRYVRTLGPEVAAVCELASYAPDPEQRLAIDLTFGLTEHGKSCASTLCLICCRQNLKTGAIKQIELGWLFVTDERLVVHSAHLFDTAREAYRDLKEIIDGSSHLRKQIKAMHDTPADMSIETITSARLVFKTRTKGAGVGKSPRKMVLDEGYALVPEHMSALRYSLSAQLDPQIIVASSACHEDSDVLRGFVGRVRADNDPRLAGLEWCSRPPSEACRDGDACNHVYGDAVGCALDDRAEILRANPQAGKRLQWQTIEDERRETVTVEAAQKHGRERAGWHDDPISGSQVIDAEKWLEAVDVESDLQPASIAIAFDVQPGNLSATITSAGRLKVGEDVIAQALELGIDTATLGKLARMRGEITGRDGGIDCRPGVDWLVDRLVEVCSNASACALVYDPSAPAGAFRQALLDSGQFVEIDEAEKTPRGKTRLVAITGREYAQACGALDADIRNGRFCHYDQKPLNDAVEGARSAPLADAWKWSRKDSSVNIAPLVAVTLARHGCAVYGGRKPKGTGWAASL